LEVVAITPGERASGRNQQLFNQRFHRRRCIRRVAVERAAGRIEMVEAVTSLRRESPDRQRALDAAIGQIGGMSSSRSGAHSTKRRKDQPPRPVRRSMRVC
jgi:hypothetical protein